MSIAEAIKERERRQAVRPSQPRCKCLACKGRTVEYSRKRMEKNLKELAGHGLFSMAYVRECLADFDEYHAKPEDEREKDDEDIQPKIHLTSEKEAHRFSGGVADSS